MKLTVAQVLIRYLKEAGVHHIFGVLGHSALEITDAIYSESGIDYVPAQIELSAAYMADGYARASRRLGVCLSSGGAGVTNLTTGIAQSYKESVPVMAIGSDIRKQFSGKGASSLHEVPQVKILEPVTKISARLERPGDILDSLRKAHRAAVTGRKGPVFLSIPEDVQKVEVDVPPPPWVETPAKAKEVDPLLVERAVMDLTRAAAPIIIAGGGVYWSESETEIVDLAKLISAPIGTTPSHKGLIPENNPLSLGVLGLGAFPFANQVCRESDVILAVGTTFSQTLTLGYGNKVIPDGAKIVQIDIDPAEIGKTYPVHLKINADAKVTLRRMIDRLKATGSRRDEPSQRLERIVKDKDQWLNEIARQGQAADGPIQRWQIFHALREAIDKETVVIGESVTIDLLRRFSTNTRVYHGGDFRAVGNALSTAIGIKYAEPTRPVVCVGGDGAFMMEIHDLATAKSSGFPILFLIVNNSVYGSMKRDQIRQYGGRVIGTNFNLPDLCSLASSFGAYTERVERPSDLLDAIRRAIASERLAVLDVLCPLEETYGGKLSYWDA